MIVSAAGCGAITAGRIPRRSHGSSPDIRWADTSCETSLSPSGAAICCRVITGWAAIACKRSDQSFNDVTNEFPLLVAGDRVTSSGFTDDANNGVLTVVSRTSGKIIVSGGSLVDEVADPGGAQVLRVSTLPHDVGRAALEAAKAWSFTRTRDPTVRSRRIAEMAYTYDLDQFGSTMEALPPRAISLLRPWVRER